MSVLTRYLPAPPPPPPLIVLAGDGFFVRQVSLLPGEAVEPQVRLALEGMSPFPPEQLYHGYLAAPEGTAALVFGAYRRRFDAALVEEWAEAGLVTPEFVALCTAPSAETAAGGVGFIRVHCGPARLVALAWTPAGGALPALVLTRGGTMAEAEALVAEVRTRAGLPDSVGVQVLEGEITGRIGAGGEAIFSNGETALTTLSPASSASVDVRDPDFLAVRRRAAVRDLWLWRTLLATAALLALAAVVELGAGVLRWQANRREAQIEAQSVDVAHLDTSQALTNRIRELSEKRLMPIDMLAAINPARPDTMIFQRTVTRGLNGLEIEAQTANAEEVGTYSAALRNLPVISEVKTREVRTREGMTSFILALQFKPEAFRDGGSK